MLHIFAHILDFFGNLRIFAHICAYFAHILGVSEIFCAYLRIFSGRQNFFAHIFPEPENFFKSKNFHHAQKKSQKFFSFQILKTVIPK